MMSFGDYGDFSVFQNTEIIKDYMLCLCYLILVWLRGTFFSDSNILYNTKCATIDMIN